MRETEKTEAEEATTEGAAGEAVSEQEARDELFEVLEDVLCSHRDYGSSPSADAARSAEVRAAIDALLKARTEAIAKSVRERNAKMDWHPHTIAECILSQFAPGAER